MVMHRAGHRSPMDPRLAQALAFLIACAVLALAVLLEMSR